MDNSTPWAVVVTIVAGISSLGGTYFGHRLALSKEKGLRQEDLDRHARYLAIRVVSVLDEFVVRCCDVAADWGMPDENGVMEPEVEAPSLKYPEDVDWKSVRPDLLYRILGFPNDISAADRAVADVSEFVAGPPDYAEYFDERVASYGQLGLTAIDLSNDIKDAYAIPKRNSENEWTPRDRLEAAILKANRRQAQRQARSLSVIPE